MLGTAEGMLMELGMGWDMELGMELGRELGMVPMVGMTIW